MTLKMDERLGYLSGNIRALREQTMRAEWNYEEFLDRKLRKLRGDLLPMDSGRVKGKQYTFEEVQALRTEYLSELEKMKDAVDSLFITEKEDTGFEHSVKLLTEFIEESK